mmetsp:Transcript_22853/g.34809  ORF Transcript_22853/g.34809 Transcript_22853/m.34809 type:complete len:265 (+) Transcript_22853:425-1219(+)
MRAHAHGFALVGLLEEASGVLCGVGHEGVVVLRVQPAQRAQRRAQHRHQLHLHLGVGDFVLVEHEGLADKLVRDLIFLAPVRCLCALQEEAECDGGLGATEALDRVQREPKHLFGGDASLFALDLPCVQAAGESERAEHQRRQRVLDPTRSPLSEVLAGDEVALKDHRRVIVGDGVHERGYSALLCLHVLIVLIVSVSRVLDHILHQRLDEVEESVHVRGLPEEGTGLAHEAGHQHRNVLAGVEGEVGDERGVVLEVEHRERRG